MWDREVDGSLEYIEGFVSPILMEAMFTFAALDVHAKGFPAAVGAADVGVLRFAAAIQPNKNAVVMLVLVE